MNRKHADGTSEYYKDLSEKIKIAHEQERRAAMRYVAYVEEKTLPQPLSVSEGSSQTAEYAKMERGLYAHQDCVEREGGELKQRWQKCLALVIVRQYNAKKEENANTGDTDMTDDKDPSDKDTETTG